MTPRREHPEDTAVAALARLHGVQPSYTSWRGVRCRASTSTLLRVLQALGVAVERPADAAAALADELVARRRRMLEPVLVRRPFAAGPHHVQLQAGVDLDRVSVAIRSEDGEEQTVGLGACLAGEPVGLGDNPDAVGGVGVGGEQMVRYPLRLPPLARRPGYHQVLVETPTASAEALLISAPAAAPQPQRDWGVFVALYALIRSGDWGTATYRDLADVGRWVAGLGGHLVATLPLLASFLSGPLIEPSPYLPASRVAWNELYVDVESLPELAGCAEARRLLASSAMRRRIAASASASPADLVGVMAARRAVLEPLADTLFRGDGSPPRRAALDEHVGGQPHLVDYARFRAATEQLDTPWPRWPSTGPKTGSGVPAIPPGAADERRVHYYLYAQWVADTQIASARAACGLYLDVPVGVDPLGFDSWWVPDSFASGATGGAPPDDFAAAGQDWGLRPLHPERMRADGYRYLRTVARHTLRHASVVRIDHVMGLHRLYWVPDGSSARDGTYVRYHSDELRALWVLEASRAGAALVGEDLGLVPGAVRRAMARDGMLRSHVQQFEATPCRPLPVPPVSSLATLGTHDLPPFAAFWDGDDIDEREGLGVLRPADAAAARRARAELRDAVSAAVARRPPRRHAGQPDAGQPDGGQSDVGQSDGGQSDVGQSDGGQSDVGQPGDRCSVADSRPTTGSDADAAAALHGWLGDLAAGPATLVVVDLEDLWLEHRPHNHPGTGAEAANFRRRSSRRFDDVAVDDSVVGPLRCVDRRRRHQGGA